MSFFELDTSGTEATLVKKHDWNHNYLVTSLVSSGSHLLVGDAISSVSVLQVMQVDEKGELVEKVKTVARDYGPLWPVSLQGWGKDGVIGANVSRSICLMWASKTHYPGIGSWFSQSDCNLFSFTLQPVTPQKNILDRDGHFHLDDHVNKFLHGEHLLCSYSMLTY